MLECADRFVAEAAVCSVHDRKHIYSGRTYVLFEEEVRPEYTGDEDGMNLERVERRERQINPQAVSRVAARAADEAARVSFIEEQAKKTRDQFEASFDWDDRKLMMSAQYWDSALKHTKRNSTTIGFHKAAEAAGARAARVCTGTVRNWAMDWHNNEGKFSESMWGKNAKCASFLQDVTIKQWTRAWVIEHGGHKRKKKNKTGYCFNIALHEHLGLAITDPKRPPISYQQSLSLLHNAGAERHRVKTGSTHTDNHGADHVVDVQRPRYSDLQAQIYRRGPNFIKVRTGWFLDEYIDKDEVPDLVQSGFLDREAAKGPRGISMGGEVKPYYGKLMSFMADGVDRVGKIWHLGCHDECCVHTLQEEGWMWIIPNVDHGDMPTKSDGEICHLAEMDVEFGCGALSLDGKLGQIERKEMVAYLRDKHLGLNPKIPLYTSIAMHAGKGNEGSWEGDDANMHLELMQDVFDILFNLEHRVPDPTKATANDILKITDAERAKFEHGLVYQIDRSQGHLKRAADSLNTKTAPGMNKTPGRKQPHFRHTFAPLPANHTDWRTCRQALCQPDCAICAAAVAKYGGRPDFQSVGKKGSQIVLTERGVLCTGALKNLPEQCERLDQEPDWGKTKPQMTEQCEARGSCILIGVACHPEMASKEHGWARLKAEVKPRVDGKYSTLRELILETLPKIGQRERLLDARRCREVRSRESFLSTAVNLF